MTIMITKEKIAVMQAYEDGKAIQYRDKKEYDWYETYDPLWDWDTFEYRVMPERKMRPYKNAEEFLQAQKVHGMYLILANNDNGEYIMPTYINNELIKACGDIYTYPKCFEALRWQDGSKCGNIEE